MSTLTKHKKQEIISLRVPSIKDGDTYEYTLNDSDFENVNFKFSTRKDETMPPVVSIRVTDENSLEVTLYNADDDKAISTRSMNITDEKQPVQLYLQLILSSTDNMGCRAWTIRFFKK